MNQGINFVQKLLVQLVTTMEKLVFFPYRVFSPRPFQKTSIGGRDAPLFGYMEIPPLPNPSQCMSRATVVQILYLSYYWGGGGVER